MSHLNQQNNFLYLLASLLILLFVSPLVAALPPSFSYWVLKAVTLVTILVSYLSLNFGPRWRMLNLSLLVILVMSSLVRFTMEWPAAPLIDLIVTLVFFVAAAFAAATRVLFSGEVDGNKIVGAVAIYILLGLIWSTLYLILLEFSPTAFNGMEYQLWEDNFAGSTYFSYVTLSTLGYGDISPAEPLSRVLVYMEAMVGTFYMAVVVASLIGARAGKKKH
jgi:voltage-gated potassium channel